MIRKDESTGCWLRKWSFCRLHYTITYRIRGNFETVKIAEFVSVGSVKQANYTRKPICGGCYSPGKFITHPI